MTRQLEIIYRKSATGFNGKQRKTIEALGLRRLQQSVRHADSPTIRGMIHRVDHLVSWREVEEGTEK